MKYYNRTVSASAAEQIKNNNAWLARLGVVYIRGCFDSPVERGKYTKCCIIYCKRGGNEWSPAYKIEQFRIYHN